MMPLQLPKILSLKVRINIVCDDNHFTIILIMLSPISVYHDSLTDFDVMTLSFDAILQLRKDTTGLYFNFIEFFIAPVVGKIFYKDKRCEKLVSEFVSVSDEAFALLIFENNYETWCDMIKTKNTKKSGVFCKYTNGGSPSGKNASSRQYQGWNAEGIKRFNVLFDLVKGDREMSHARPFEEDFKAYCDKKCKIQSRSERLTSNPQGEKRQGQW